LSGGLLTVLGGSEGGLFLTDTPHPTVQEHYGPQTSGMMLLPDEHTLEVWQLRKNHEVAPGEEAVEEVRRTITEGRDVRDRVKGPWSFALAPGPFTWYGDDRVRADLPWGLWLLHRLARPLPAFSRSLDGDVTVNVANYYPHTESVPYSPAERGEGG